MEDRDIIAMAMNDTDAVVQVFCAGKRLIGRDHLASASVRRRKNRQIPYQLCEAVLRRNPFLPKELWVQQELDDMEVIEQWLSARRGQKVRIVVPKKGEKERLVELGPEERVHGAAAGFRAQPEG